MYHNLNVMYGVTIQLFGDPCGAELVLIRPEKSDIKTHTAKSKSLFVRSSPGSALVNLIALMAPCN